MALSTELISAGIGSAALLVGAIYRDLTRRLTVVEKAHTEMMPKLIEISADVKHIRRNCPRVNCEE